MQGRTKPATQRKRSLLGLCALWLTVGLQTANKAMAQKIVNGKVGQQFKIAQDFQGRWENAVGVPVDAPVPAPQQVAVPPGAPQAPRLVVVERPDFRKLDKAEKVFGRK
eukprot:TRINITY_DN14327_c0_g1_i2.p2 TRINITY_DN14327_c0_g1~~TRINITY_DN14327_c0_g1_i2.p2  ORF type:complete len:109 (+),score=26.88 TRINITY_DN14327_c0_g1_i2:185-511(+)